MLSSYILSPELIPNGLNYTAVEYIKSQEYIAACDGNNIILVRRAWYNLKCGQIMNCLFSAGRNQDDE